MSNYELKQIIIDELAYQLGDEEVETWLIIQCSEGVVEILRRNLPMVEKFVEENR